MSQLYDVDQFVPAPSVELICAVCQNVLLDPVECDCRHVFCRSCISKWLAEGPDSSCPKCRSRVSVISLRTVVPLLQNLLNELQLRCANAGCDWQKSLEQYDAHVKVCAFRRLPCPHKGCFQTLPSDSLGAHKEACEHRVIKCSDWCGLDFTLQQRSSHNCRTAVLTLLNGMQSCLNNK
ncbi:hypothetical protein CAPTEDRAFT_90186 [Capitella teleta]|uniref:RING-type domain-containing protein n=1 Tax=Capitella teleta TaxID=283909 RepID=R7T499_CAPTE|nr:hypothetical protein CAPTEDRAFT_90186 [Capitella teleta]|eukprot:ELT87673.1 hypothetical protein CAPTEDRAFT_90186 [Capitella teleta]